MSAEQKIMIGMVDLYVLPGDNEIPLWSFLGNRKGSLLVKKVAGVLAAPSFVGWDYLRSRQQY